MTESSVVTDEPLREPEPEVSTSDGPPVAETADENFADNPAEDSAAAHAEPDDAEGDDDEDDEGQSGDERPPRQKKGSWQKSVDRLTRQRADAERLLAEERGRRLALEELLAKAGAPKPPGADDKGSTPEPEAPAEPQPEDYDSIEEYARAFSKWEREQESKPATPPAEEAPARFEANPESIDIRIKSREAAIAKFEDFDERIEDLAGELNPAILSALEFDEDGAEIAYHLASNLEEARRIAALPESQVAKAIQRFAGKVVGTTPAPHIPADAGLGDEEEVLEAPRARPQPQAARSRAQPVGTVLGGGRVSSDRDLDSMSPAEYEAYMNRKERAGW